LKSIYMGGVKVMTTYLNVTRALSVGKPFLSLFPSTLWISPGSESHVRIIFHL
jgi:hypothetical protein